MSAYSEGIKDAMRRVLHLTADYEAALKGKDFKMAAVIRGQLGAARAYLQGFSDAGEVLLGAGHDVTGGDRV